MAKTLYVSNLPFSVTESQIHALFSQAGKIRDIKIITDRFTGSPKGFGYIQMVNEKAAEEAITRFNGYVLDDRLLNVSVARSFDEISETVGGVMPKNNAAGGNRL
jgi:cold-inducible RNA-binding protein